jgi:hypothetical protein
MSKICKFISLFLVSTIWLSTQSFTSQSVIAQEPEGSKITIELQEALDELDNDDLVPVYVWINDIDHESVKEIVFDNTGFSEEMLMDVSYEIYKPLKDNSIHKMDEQFGHKPEFEEVDAVYSGSEINDIQNVDEDYIKKVKDFYVANQDEILQLSADVDTYISEKRAIAREEYNKQNNAFVEEYLEEANISFISSYAPMIICDTTKEKINELNNIEEVESISLCTDVENCDDGNMDISVPSINGSYVRDILGLDGDGIKIGQIESGRPEENIVELASTLITRGGDDNNTSHASRVAAIMAGATGMAPRAELFCTTLVGNVPSTFYANTEWLLSKGVKVINRSSTDLFSHDYDDVAKWVDHIVNCHNVSWVQVPGNLLGANDNPVVRSPGNAYNVITVCAIDDNGTVNSNDDSYYSNNLYTTNNNLPNKPDVVAPGVGFYVTGCLPKSGTSFAAPHVTGMIAQMMQYMPTLSLRPDAVKAAVLASCDRKVTNETMAWITDREGAGVINAFNAICFINNIATQQSYYNTTASSFGLIYDPLTYGTKTVAISWLKQNIGCDPSTTSNPTFTNFNLKVLDEDNNVVASSQSYYNSAELVRFTAVPGITYTIKVTRYTNNSTSEKLSVAFYG